MCDPCLARHGGMVSTLNHSHLHLRPYPQSVLPHLGHNLQQLRQKLLQLLGCGHVLNELEVLIHACIHAVFIVGLLALRLLPLCMLLIRVLLTLMLVVVCFCGWGSCRLGLRLDT